ncbi:MAG TPA: hypothetical protein PKE39_13530 [Ignavibacteria bacterium]|nr:hypothetical protein [Ignavibacteria bacterium]HMR00041.1 hypothetical protein [Ignavibacteria bacterium]
MTEKARSKSLQGSILKEILLNKQCSTGKYLAPMRCTNSKNTVLEFYITPVVTRSKKNVLIISKIIKGNWYEALLNIDTIVKYIKSVYDFSDEMYTVVMHAYFEVVELEKFYVVDTKDKYVLNKLKYNEFENILS